MKHILITLYILLIGGCAGAPTKPQHLKNSDVINKSFDDTWNKAMQVLAADGYPIATTSKESGIISTSPKTMRLNETQANCGSAFGIDYMGDYRVTTKVVHSIILQKQKSETQVTINTQIDGVFIASAVNEPKNLQCLTQGGLEEDLLSKLAR